MNEFEVRLEQLEPMRLAYISINSQTPEEDSLKAILAWAKESGVLKGSQPYRLFGYDNCLPDPDHVYTACITVGPEVEAEGEISIRDYPGGLCAVVSVTGVDNIGKGWQRLAEWHKSSHYRLSDQQNLEEHLTPLDVPLDEFRLDLYLPLEE